jgi:hypothetical protein
MFQAFGVHGPELTPAADVVIDVALVVLAFTFLITAPRSSRHDAALLGTMVVAVTALRVLMQPLPNVQPVTVAALLVGAQLGARRGVAFAILVTLLSNMLIGDGWWTLFQAAGWGAVAVLGSRLTLMKNGDFNHGQLYLAVIGSAFLFGALASLSIFTPSMGLVDFAIYLAHGIPFDILHALGNLAFAVWFGPFVHRQLGGLESSHSLEQSVVEHHVING